MKQLELFRQSEIQKPKISLADKLRRLQTAAVLAGAMAVGAFGGHKGCELVVEEYLDLADKCVDTLSKCTETSKRLGYLYEERERLLDERARLLEAKNDSLNASYELLEVQQRFFGLRYVDEEGESAVRAAIREVFGENNPSRMHAKGRSDSQIILVLYDWVQKNIRYSTTHEEPKRLSEILERGMGDCDEQATLLASMIGAMAIGETRIIGTEREFASAAPILPWEGSSHAYVQYRIHRFRNGFSAQEYEDAKKAIALEIMVHYGIPAKSLDAVMRNIEPGLDLDRLGVWLTLDTTGSFPGDSCLPSSIASFGRFCAPRFISYVR